MSPPGSQLPILAIVGRPNVGKSTLFNRILGTRHAIVEDRARTTRDRLYGEAEWNGRRFVIVDTGGLELDTADPIEARVQEQARLAIAEADVIVFVVDAQAGITPPDLEAAELLRRATSPVLVAANKADNDRRELEAAEFFSLGWDETYPISAAHGRGTGDLLDAIVWALPPETEAELARKAREAEAEAWARDVADGFLEPLVVGDEPLGGPDGDGADEEPGAESGDPAIDAAARKWDAAIAAESEDTPVAIAIVGRPNVGKSSLLNALLGEERSIVSEIPGTTRDAIDTTLAYGRSEIVLIDTGRDAPAGQDRLGPDRRALLRVADPPRGRPGGRGDPRPRRGRWADRPGCARRGLRRRGGPRPGHRDQQVGPARREDRQDLRRVRRLDPARGPVPRLRPGRLDQREDRPAGGPGPRGRGRRVGRAAQADPDRRAQPAPRGGRPAPGPAARQEQAPEDLLRAPRRPWRPRRS